MRSEELAKPNLFIIGAMKSGTTYLADLLAAHPSIFMCFPKEPCFFVDPEQLRILWPWAWAQRYWEHEESYLGLFGTAGAATIIGEASVYYAHFPLASGVPERIHRFNPNARFIYIVRDPIERTISHYWHRVRWHEEGRPLMDAIKADPQYMDVSYYAMQLKPYLDIFARNQIMTLTFEDLIRDPGQVLKTLFRWLDVDPLFEAPLISAQNVTPDKLTKPIWSGMLHRIRHKNRLVRRAIDLVPSAARRPIARALRRPVGRVDDGTKNAIQHLRPTQQKQIEELSQMIGRNFPEWHTLNYTGNIIQQAYDIGREPLAMRQDISDELA